MIDHTKPDIIKLTNPKRLGLRDNSGIILKNLIKKFEDITAVDNLNLEIEQGELFALLGPNGADKTTNIKILCGLLQPTSGSISIGGYDSLKEASKIRPLIGFCPQETAAFTFLTGKENLELFGRLYGMPKDLMKQNVQNLLEKLFLTDHADRRVQKYSGGLTRRISLAMALVHDPEIAFLDEPTVAMDPQSRRAVWDFIRELKQKNKTIILTTHYMEEAEELSDRVGIIDNGKLIALGSAKELNQKHQTKNLEDLFIKLTGKKIREAV
jgi:ABC-2 type transport system ATP-binding protein